MQTIQVRIFLYFIILINFFPSFTFAEQRTALVIGNSNYSAGPLKNPVNDAADMAAALRKAGFTVILKRNASLQEMEEAIEDFGNRLKRGGVGLFYYAGHGVQVNGINYLIPPGAKVNKGSDVKYQAVDVNKVLDEMGNANNGLNIVILDACRDNPFGRSFRNVSRGLAIVSNAPTGTFISYSTGAGQVARDGTGRNSPYTSALLKYILEPGMPINDVFMNVRQKLQKETGQVPWELSSLVGKFYFVQGKAGKAEDEVKAATARQEAAGAALVDMDDQRQQLEAERERLRREKELLEQKEALAEERRMLEEKKKQLALREKQPSASGAREVRRDGRFIAYDDGTVLDTRTNLMWAASDNGSEINWLNAKSYCDNYRAGGYTDWRLPTLQELLSLHDKAKPRPTACDAKKPIGVATGLINITCTVEFSSIVPHATGNSDSVVNTLFSFITGNGYPLLSSRARPIKYARVLPVRNANRF